METQPGGVKGTMPASVSLAAGTTRRIGDHIVAAPDVAAGSEVVGKAKRRMLAAA
jgi:hypothetical protein